MQHTLWSCTCKTFALREVLDPCVQTCPTAWVAIITNPVNSTVPIAAEVLKEAGCFNPKTLFGVTTLDVVRARTFVAEILKLDPDMVRFEVLLIAVTSPLM
jgi:malate/lactate dehydrogenase